MEKAGLPVPARTGGMTISADSLAGEELKKQKRKKRRSSRAVLELLIALSRHTSWPTTPASPSLPPSAVHPPQQPSSLFSQHIPTGPSSSHTSPLQRSLIPKVKVGLNSHPRRLKCRRVMDVDEYIVSVANRTRSKQKRKPRWSIRSEENMIGERPMINEDLRLEDRQN